MWSAETDRIEELIFSADGAAQLTEAWPRRVASAGVSSCLGSHMMAFGIVGDGDNLQNLERALSWCSQRGYTTETHQMPRGPMCARHAGGKLPVDGVDWCCCEFVASNGPVWRRMVVVASKMGD